MTQMNPDTGLAALAQRLDSLDVALSNAVAHAHRRNVAVAVVMTLTILFLVFYLGFAYHVYGNQVTPELVAANLQVQFNEALPAARQQLEANLKNNAPQYVNQMIDQLQSMPDQYAAQLQDAASTAMDKAMPKATDDLYQALKSALDDAQRSPANGNDEQRFQATLAALTQVYGEQTTKMVDQLHNDYAADSVSFTDYLQRLGKNQDLDARDQMHRELFRNMLMLIRERSTSPAGSQLETNTIAPAK